jgi:aromatic ring-opening dioxygenase catalytic subunit (LigB family)
MFPDAEIPTIQLSLIAGLDPAQHLAMGRALAPLRDQGVVIMGSGMTYHNLSEFFSPRAREVSEVFDRWLQETTTRPAHERNQRLLNWERAPAARKAHPREEHLLPLVVMAGAAGDNVGTVTFSHTFMGVRHSAFHFG